MRKRRSIYGLVGGPTKKRDWKLAIHDVAGGMKKREKRWKVQLPMLKVIFSSFLFFAELSLKENFV